MTFSQIADDRSTFANQVSQKIIKTSTIKISVYMVILLLFWTAVILLSLWFGIRTTVNYSNELALMKAGTIFDTDTAYQQLFVNMGGVYVAQNPQSEHLKNYYQNIPSVNIGKASKNLSDHNLVYLTPLDLTRLAHDAAAEKFQIKSHIVSLRPFHNHEFPDHWEIDALTKLNNSENSKEISSLEKLENGREYFRFMRPWADSDNSCYSYKTILKNKICQGFSTSIPIDSIKGPIKETVWTLTFSHLALWLFGLMLVTIGSRRLKTHSKERGAAENRLRKLTNELEERINVRTHELRRRQQELQSFMDNTDAGVYLKNEKGQFILVNSRFSSIMKVPSEKLLGSNGYGLLPAAAFKKMIETERQVNQEGRELEIKNLFERPSDENSLIFSASIFPVINNDSKTVEGVGGTLVNVTARHQLEKALIMAKDTAENANRAKSDFLANVSHEIRTPLNGVIGMADILMRTHLTPDQASMAATIKAGGDSLLSVLNDVLDFSKIEAGKLYLDPMPFSLRDIVFDAVKGLAPIAYKKRLETIVNIAPQVPDNLVGDYVRFRQIILNLIGNAIKFTDSGEVAITISLLKQHKQLAKLRISVSDTGIGIPLEKQRAIFEAFEQADTSTTRRYGGTGLGLAISSKLATLMNSKLCLKSQPGVGATFWFNLELPCLPENKLAKMPTNLKGLEGLSILFVDDNETNRRIVMEQLHSWKLVGQEAASVDEALRLLKVAANSIKPFSLVLSDLQMPGKDGLDLIKRMKQNPTLADIHVVLLSSGDLPNDISAEEQSAAYLCKPVRPEDLIRTIARLLGAWERLDSNDLQAVIKKDQTKISSVKLKTLLTEDMEMNRLVATRMLEELGHEVTIAINGQEAVNLVGGHHFDIIFMDVQMPVMDGVEAVSQIRALEKHENKGPVPIVAMTAHALKGDREKYLNLGMDAYITKPLSISSLSEAIDEMLVKLNLGKVKIKQSQVTAQNQVDFASDHESEIFDEEILQASFIGDLELTKKSMELYIRDAPGLLNDIEAAINANDNENLISKAHALKGISSYYSKTGPFELSLALENKGRTKALPQDFAALLDLFQNLEKSVKRIMQAMNAYIKKKSGVNLKCKF